MHRLQAGLNQPVNPVFPTNLCVDAFCVHPLLANYCFCRLWVLYLLTALLIVLLGTMLVRYLVFAVVWVVTGSHFWLLPNLMSETVRRGLTARG